MRGDPGKGTGTRLRSAMLGDIETRLQAAGSQIAEGGSKTIDRPLG